MSCKGTAQLEASGLRLVFHALILSSCLQGPTWQQAIQWMEEVRVETGSTVTLLAKHDTYAISFAWQPSMDTHHSQSAKAEMSTDADHDSAVSAAHGAEEAGSCPYPEQAVVPLKVINHMPSGCCCCLSNIYHLSCSSIHGWAVGPHAET